LPGSASPLWRGARHGSVDQAPRGGEPDVGFDQSARGLVPLAPVPQRADLPRTLPPALHRRIRVDPDEVLAWCLTYPQRSRVATDTVECARGAHQVEAVGLHGEHPAGRCWLQMVEAFGVPRPIAPHDGSRTHTVVLGQLLDNPQRCRVVTDDDGHAVAV